MERTNDEDTQPEQSSPKRGRPPTGMAMSAADRQARRVAKLEAEGKALLPRIAVSREVQQALYKFIQFKDMTLGDALERILHDRLIRKR
ncbi:hypothetical protein [Massilia timonae]|nr:hypothetical protein [Massilia timonae]